MIAVLFFLFEIDFKLVQAHYFTLNLTFFYIPIVNFDFTSVILNIITIISIIFILFYFII